MGRKQPDGALSSDWQLRDRKQTFSDSMSGPITLTRQAFGKALVAAFLLLAVSASADTLTGKVVKVADGDTVTVLDNTNHQHRIRLQGIDAPEKAQPYGNASRKHLASLVAGKTVTVQWDKHDRYGRIVGTVFVDGRDVDLEQIKAGMAWFYRYYQKELSVEQRKLYARAEDEARANKKDCGRTRIRCRRGSLGERCGS